MSDEKGRFASACCNAPRITAGQVISGGPTFGGPHPLSPARTRVSKIFLAVQMSKDRTFCTEPTRSMVSSTSDLGNIPKDLQTPVIP